MLDSPKVPGNISSPILLLFKRILSGSNAMKKEMILNEESERATETLAGESCSRVPDDENPQGRKKTLVQRCICAYFASFLRCDRPWGGGGGTYRLPIERP